MAKGASIASGSASHVLGGTYFQPTILKGVTKDMLIAKEETFCSVAPLFKFDSVNDVIAQANNTDFGLVSYFNGNDLSQVWRVAEALEYGMVGVNTGPFSTEVAPFGGIKQSGQGREGSKHETEDYLEQNMPVWAASNVVVELHR